MSIVYLKDGTKANLISKVEDQYLVRPYCIYVTNYGEQCEEYEDESDRCQLVNEFFEKPPVKVVDEELKEKRETLSKLTQEISILQKDTVTVARKLKEKSSQLDKGIIDLSVLNDAKRITVFVNGKIKPKDFNTKEIRGCKLSTTIEIRNGKERSWCYTLWDDDSYSNSFSLDLKYGFLIDKTDEEIEKITLKRVKETEKWPDWEISNTDDKYLTKDLQNIKSDLKYAKNEKEILKYKKELNRLQVEITKIEEHGLKEELEL